MILILLENAAAGEGAELQLSGAGTEHVEVVNLLGRTAEEARLRFGRAQRFGVQKWLDAEDVLSDRDGWVGEVLDWLAEKPKSGAESGSLLGRFRFRDEVSLWWFTKVSQRKQVKSPLAEHAKLAYRAQSMVEERFGNGRESPPDHVVCVGSTPEFARTLQQAIAAAVPPTVECAITAVTGTTRARAQRGSGTGLLRGIPSGLRGLLRLTRSLARSYAGILRQQIQFLRLDRSALPPQDQPRRVAVFSWDVGDFVETAAGEWQNRYLPTLEEAVENAGGSVDWLLLDQNAFIRGNRHRALRESLGVHYSVFRPEWGNIGSIFLANVGWLLSYFRLRHSPMFGSLWTYRGVDLSDLIREDYEQLLSGHAARLLYMRACFRSALRRRDPEAVLYLKAFNSIGRTLASAAPEGVQMIGVQHGIVNNEQIGYLYRSSEIDPRPAAEADHVAHCPAPDVVVSFGQRLVDFMGAAGFPRERVLPIGSLRHDRVTAAGLGADPTEQISERRSRAAGELPEEMPIVLLCGQWEEPTVGWFRLLHQARQELELPFYILVKPHPFEPATADRIDEVVKRDGVRDYGFSSGSIEEALVAADVAVTHSSTAALDALLLSTPVVLIDQPDLPNDNSLYRDSGATWLARDASEMAQALAVVLRKQYDVAAWDCKRRDFLTYNLNNEDAGAVGRLLDLVYAPQETGS